MPGFGLRDKMVVITGGGGALGSAFARGFADHGASVAILDFDLDNAKPTAARFPAEKVIKLNDKDINRAREPAQIPMLSNTLHFIHRRSRQSRRR